VGLTSNFLITFAILPFMLDFIKYEGSKMEQNAKELERMNIFQRHRDVLLVYTAFFAGMVLTQSIIFFMLPENLSQSLFKDQLNQIDIIRGMASLGGTFQGIVINNLGVLLLSFFFSFLFGAGAIFILSWNASVLSTAIGMTAKSIGGLKAIPLAVLGYFPHGSLEILAYFIGGIAGGLISVAMTKRKTEKFWFVIKDSVELMAVSIILLLVAGAIETTMMLV
jgi:uncharacterized membrane protein SpoIIM required for sporulation